MRHVPVLILILPAVFAAAGCKKKTEAPSAPPPLDAVPVETAASPAEATPEPDAPPSFTPGELLVGAPLGDLGVTASYPKNLTLRVEERRAELSAPGFYPVRITVEPLTLENAVMKISVNGVPQLTTGTTYDGQAKVYQTSCLLVRCLVDHPNPYLADVAEVGRAICDSIAEVPPPTEGYLRQLRDNSYSFGGSCGDEDRGRQATFQSAVGLAQVKDAVAACWRDAAAARPDWRAAQPVVRVGWNLSRADPPRWKVVLDDLEGDTAALQTCLEQALEPARAALPADVRTAPDCIATFTAVYDLDHRPVCPGTASAPPDAAAEPDAEPVVDAGRDPEPAPAPAGPAA